MHQARLTALLIAVSALFHCRKLQLTELGRHRGGQQRYGIKAIDKLLGNKHLHSELPWIYRVLCRLALHGERQPLLVIDWTDVGERHAALSAAIPVGGRSITIYQEVHRRKYENNPNVERRFLENLKSVLPKGCCPVILTDAGFRVPWLKIVRAAGFHFVTRVRGRVYVETERTGCWKRLREIFGEATKRPTDLGPSLLSRYLAFPCRLVTFADRPYAQTRRKKLPRKGHRQRKHVRAAREPWVLATSLTGALPKEVVAAYRCRMRIEETFRDVKSARLGWSLEHAQSRTANRLAVLMLIAALAHYVAILVGQQAEAQRLQFAYQANSIKHRRVLSLARLGFLILEQEAQGPPLAIAHAHLVIETYGAFRGDP
jgi:hypothetical protein